MNILGVRLAGCSKDDGVGGGSEYTQEKRHLELWLIKAREHVACISRSEVAGHVLTVTSSMMMYQSKTEIQLYNSIFHYK